MEQTARTIITFGVMVSVVFGLYFFSDWFSKTTGYVLGEDEKLKLAQCLSTKDAIFYSSATCPKCEDQIEIFGKTATEFLEIVSCDTASDCPSGGVPAWKIGKQTYYGVKQLDELVSISGCSLE
ncbi:MAG: hypothetical protein ACP5NS_00735 [Candidatus Pacearchaeota archaeon]